VKIDGKKSLKRQRVMVITNSEKPVVVSIWDP
jgi:hypothetical protein